MSGKRRGLAGWDDKSRGTKSLEAGLRTGYADDGRTSQGLEPVSYTHLLGAEEHTERAPNRFGRA